MNITVSRRESGWFLRSSRLAEVCSHSSELLLLLARILNIPSVAHARSSRCTRRAVAAQLLLLLLLLLHAVAACAMSKADAAPGGRGTASARPSCKLRELKQGEDARAGCLWVRKGFDVCLESHSCCGSDVLSVHKRHSVAEEEEVRRGQPGCDRVQTADLNNDGEDERRNQRCRMFPLTPFSLSLSSSLQQHKGAINLTSESPNRNAQFGGMQRELQLIVNVMDSTTQDLVPSKAIHTPSTHMFASFAVGSKKRPGGTGSCCASSDMIIMAAAAERALRLIVICMMEVRETVYIRTVLTQLGFESSYGLPNLTAASASASSTHAAH